MRLVAHVFVMMAAVAGNAGANEAKKPVAAAKEAFEIATRLRQPAHQGLFTEPGYTLGLVFSIIEEDLGTPILIDFRTFPNVADARTILKETDVPIPGPR